MNSKPAIISKPAVSNYLQTAIQDFVNSQRNRPIPKEEEKYTERRRKAMRRRMERKAMNNRQGKQSIYKEEKHVVELAADDVVFAEILPRVPASSLLRLRAVCKSWNSVIRDPAFARTNLERALANMPTSCRMMLFHHRIQELVSLDESMSRPKTVFRTHQFVMVSPPCNGLVCIYGSGLQLFNLTTRELLPLPTPEHPRSPRWTFHLGFDPSSNKYKVVCHDVHEMECQVLTVGAGTAWRRIGRIDTPDGAPHRSVAIGGFLFRVMQHKHDSHDRVKVPVVFDVKEEKFRWLSLPSSRISFGNVLDIQGKPCFVEEYRDTSIFTYGLHLWTLVDVDREVWIHRCLMPPIGGGLDQVRLRGYPNIMVWSRPVLIAEGKVLLCYGSQLYYLHLGSGDWEEMRRVARDDEYYDNHVLPFVGNLTSLREMLSE